MAQVHFNILFSEICEDSQYSTVICRQNIWLHTSIRPLPLQRVWFSLSYLGLLLRPRRCYPILALGVRMCRSRVRFLRAIWLRLRFDCRSSAAVRYVVVSESALNCFDHPRCDSITNRTDLTLGITTFKPLSAVVLDVSLPRIVNLLCGMADVWVLYVRRGVGRVYDNDQLATDISLRLKSFEETCWVPGGVRV